MEKSKCYNKEMKNIKVGYPVDQQLVDKISSPYGFRTHPISKEKKMHWGLDYAIPSGSFIYSILPGMCVITRDDGDVGFGKWALIHSFLEDFRYQDLFCFYAHLDKIIVEEGKNVVLGEHIGYSGNTGGSSGPHLHFQICKDNARKSMYSENAIDPMEILSIRYDQDKTSQKERLFVSLQADGLIPEGGCVLDNVTYDVLFDILKIGSIKG